MVEQILGETPQTPQVGAPAAVVIAYRCQPGTCRAMRFISEEVTAVTGFTPADFTEAGVHWDELVHPEDRARRAATLTKAAATERPFQVEYRLLDRAGAEHWIWEQGQAVRDARDALDSFSGFISDVTERHRSETALRTRNERYELILSGTCDAIWDWDIINHRIYYSPRWKALRGFEPDELDDHEGTWRAGIHPADCERVMAAVEAHLEGSTAYFAEEYRIHCKDGSWRWILDRGIAVRDASGRVIRMAGAGSDITERKRAEQALRESEERYHTLMELLPSAVYTCDSAGRIAFFNEWAVALWGRRPDVGDTELRFCGALCLRSPDGELLAKERSPMAKAIRDGVSSRNQEVVVERPDGERRHVLVNTDPLYGAGGELIGAVNVMLDITDRRRVEEELGRSEARFRQLADAMPQLVWSARPDGVTDYVNRRAAEYADIRCAADGSWHWASMLVTEDRERTLEAWRAALGNGAPYQCEHRLRLADGSERWHLSRAVPVRDEDGRVCRWFGTATDVEALRQAQEALEEADRRKDEFLATLAHELRNPLAPIANALGVLKLRGVPDAKAEAAQAMIDRQLQHLVRLIDDLMDVSRITRGHLSLRCERVTLAAALEPALEAFEPQLERAGVALQLDLPEQPVVLFADPVRLSQVFLNLLSNACKFTPEGGRITLSAERVGGQVVVRVRDTGVGIVAEDLPRLFEMFTQVGESAGQKPAGLGIGLSLARGLIELHGGCIEARSDGLGQGTEFIVQLPMMSEPSRVVSPSHGEASPAAVRRVLVVDDHADIVDSLSLLLEASGHEVVTARDGEEAVAAAERDHPDVVLLDIGMPKLDGYGACQRIRSQAWGQGMRLIALTGWGQDADRQRTTDAGFDGHLVKPVSPAALLRVVNESPPSEKRDRPEE